MKLLLVWSNKNSKTKQKKTELNEFDTLANKLKTESNLKRKTRLDQFPCPEDKQVEQSRWKRQSGNTVNIVFIWLKTKHNREQILVSFCLTGN